MTPLGLNLMAFPNSQHVLERRMGEDWIQLPTRVENRSMLLWYLCTIARHIYIYIYIYIYMVVRFQNQYICCMDMAMPSSQTLWGSGSSSPPVLSGLSSTQGESLRGWESGTSGTKASGKDFDAGTAERSGIKSMSMGKVSAQSGHGSVPVGLEPRRAEWSWYWTVANCSNPRVTQQFQEV